MQRTERLYIVNAGFGESGYSECRLVLVGPPAWSGETGYSECRV
ncbi:unnamed protein product, partial [Staurois parvus]